MKRLAMSVMLVALFAFGCAKKQIKSEPVAPAKEPVVSQQQVQPEPVQPEVTQPEQEKTVAPSPMELYEQKYSQLPTSHTVVKGECLWWIAEYKQIYNDPFMWPLIYKANRDKIKNPDLIYPNQVFVIPRHFSLQELKASRKMAGAPRPYLPPQDANLPADLRQELGWSF
ncbi:MAG: LysM peptidoglycan-binding domain-containing protein [Desulfonauticus sp.]|nr:LysM peptidoglycan-binding domain-containing protein [Desulfonauticus sp.]